MIKNYSYTSRHNKENDEINLSKTIRKKSYYQGKTRREHRNQKQSQLYSFIFSKLKAKKGVQNWGQKIPMQLRVK